MMNEDQEWLDYRNRFSAVYDESNYASPLQAFAMRSSHRPLRIPSIDLNLFFAFHAKVNKQGLDG
jgi:hypothetical protein